MDCIGCNSAFLSIYIYPFFSSRFKFAHSFKFVIIILMIMHFLISEILVTVLSEFTKVK